MKCGYRLCPRSDAIPIIRIFLIRNFFFLRIRFPSTRSRWIRPADESATSWIRSPEWKFLNTLWIRKFVDAKCGIFLSGDVKKSNPVLYSERQSKMQISRALRRMLCCQYSKRSPVNRFEYGHLRTWKFFNPDQKSCGFKNIWTRVEVAWMWCLAVIIGRKKPAFWLFPLKSC